MNPCTCWAVLTDPTRKQLFQGIFPDDKIPITPEEGKGKTDAGEEFDFWLVDWKRTTETQRKEIFLRVSQKFGIPSDMIEQEAMGHGIPVKKEGAEFHFCPNHLRWGDHVFSDRGFM